MRDFCIYLLSVLYAIGLSLYGSFDGVLKLLVFMILFDYVTGVISSIKNKKINSRVGFYGIIKKCVLMGIVALSYKIDCVLFDNAFLRNVVIFFYVSNEGISIIENCNKLGIPIPEKLKEVFEQLKKKGSNYV